MFYLPEEKQDQQNQVKIQNVFEILHKNKENISDYENNWAKIWDTHK